MIQDYLKKLVQTEIGQAMARNVKEFIVDDTKAQVQANTFETSSLLSIIKLQQKLLDDLVNRWDPDVMTTLTKINDKISKLENYNESAPRT
jgi:hypothetical protein